MSGVKEGSQRKGECCQKKKGVAVKTNNRCIGLGTKLNKRVIQPSVGGKAGVENRKILNRPRGALQRMYRVGGEIYERILKGIGKGTGIERLPKRGNSKAKANQKESASALSGKKPATQ